MKEVWFLSSFPRPSLYSHLFQPIVTQSLISIVHSSHALVSPIKPKHHLNSCYRKMREHQTSEDNDNENAASQSQLQPPSSWLVDAEENHMMTDQQALTKLNLRFQNFSILDTAICTITSLTTLDLSNNRVYLLSPPLAFIPCSPSLLHSHAYHCSLLCCHLRFRILST